MLISGLQKLTLLDYPGRVACTVFTGGCNFRCPFCHNASLVLPEQMVQDTNEEEVLSFLKKRVGVLDGVAVTGGEPLLHKDIGGFLSKGWRIDVFFKTLMGLFGAGKGGEENQESSVRKSGAPEHVATLSDLEGFVEYVVKYVRKMRLHYTEEQFQ